MTALAAAPGSQIVRMDEQGDITREPCVGFYHVQGSMVFPLSISGGQMNARSAVMTPASAEYEDGLVSYPHGKLTFASMSEWMAYMEAVDPQVDDEPTEAEMAGGGGVDDVIGKASTAASSRPPPVNGSATRRTRGRSARKPRSRKATGTPPIRFWKSLAAIRCRSMLRRSSATNTRPTSATVWRSTFRRLKATMTTGWIWSDGNAGRDCVRMGA